MDGLPLKTKIIKSLVATARYNDGHSVFLICLAEDERRYLVYEQTPDGACKIWPEVWTEGAPQAECMIFQRDGLKE